MQGLAITDLNGRRILSTHFPSTLLSALAIDTASSTQSPIAWVSNLDAPLDAAASAESSSSDESDVEDDAGWDTAKGAGTGAAAGAGGRKRAVGGQAVCQIVRGGLRLIVPIAGDVDPVLPLSFLNEVYSVLEYYIDGPVTEASVKDHFDLILSLMDEMLSAGRPSLTSGPQLRELVPPLDRGVAAKLAAEVAAAGLSGGTSTSGAKALLASPIPWRRTGLKYKSNEIYFDLTESLSLLLNARGSIITSSVTGQIQCRSKLSGMPDLTMNFLDPQAMTDVAFHPSVRGARWRKEKVVSFVPPDGAFPLLTYSAPAPPTPALPLLISSLLTCGALGGSIQISLTARTTLQRLVVRVPLPRDAGGFNVTLAGGAWVEQGKPSGAGRWEVEDGAEGEKELVWVVAGLRTGDRAAVLQAQYLTTAGDPPPAYRVEFECPASGFSGLRIAGVKVGAESYSIFKGVKVTGRAEVEVRT